MNPTLRDMKEMAIDLQNSIKRINDIEYRLNAIVELPTELDIRLEECERLLDKWSEKIVAKRPHKCPVCDGCGNSKGTIESNPNFDFHAKYAHCHACEGKGIVWG